MDAHLIALHHHGTGQASFYDLHGRRHGSPSMSCGKADNWISEDAFPADSKRLFIGIMLAV
jgi:hypothetical protein